MNYTNFMSKVRQWDNKTNQWFFRNFYVLFFQIILVGVFIIFFFNTINVINVSLDTSRNSVMERLMVEMNVNTLLIVFLMILNSFWMLILLTSVFKVRSVLKNIESGQIRKPADRERRANPEDY